MNSTFLLLLCICLVIPTCLSQEMTCTRQEVPESAINCSTIDSVFLTCACNTYKTSILEIMGSVACLIPGLDFAPGNIPPTPEYIPPTAPISPTAVTNQNVSSTIPMNPIVTMYSSQPRQDGGGGFRLTSLFNQQLSDTIKNITSKIGEEAFDKLCEGIPALRQCVTSGYKQSTKSIDVILRTYFNFDNLGDVLTSVCNLKAEIFGKVDCLTDAALPMSACVGFSVFSNPQSPADMMSGDLNTYCPIAGDVTRCIGIQAKSCSTQLGTTIRNVLPDLLSPSCGQLATTGSSNPIMTTPLICSLSSMLKTQKIIGDLGTDVSYTSRMNEIIGSLIDVYCGEMSSLFTCMHEELPSSMNPVDKFIKAIVDVNQFAYADTLTQYICEPSRVQAIKAALPCLMTKEAEIGRCVQSQQAFGFNFSLSTIGMDESQARMKFCGPIQTVMNCAIDTVLATCDPDLATASRDVYLSLLRTDCNGIRNGTGGLQGAINAQRQATTTPGNNAPTTVVKQSIPTLTLLILLFLLL